MDTSVDGRANGQTRIIIKTPVHTKMYNKSNRNNQLYLLITCRARNIFMLFQYMIIIK